MKDELALRFAGCRICGSHNVKHVGTVEYYSGFAGPIYDCGDCRSRFTLHHEAVYDLLHREAGSCYNVYRALLDRCAEAFARGDREFVRRELCQTSKYKFIIEEVERLPRDSRLLEIGCSRGHLTSYFILAGYPVTGMDISDSAVAAARAAFGDHFIVSDSQLRNIDGQYDVIYHVGTIGCVADPMGLTRGLLHRLKPGGCLLFNSPNLKSCYLREQLWIDAAPPPDLVSMFAPGFWKEHFRSEALVEEQIETTGTKRAAAIGVEKFFRRRWSRPTPVPLDKSSELYMSGRIPTKRGTRSLRDGAWELFGRSFGRFCNVTGLSAVAPSQPSEFGLFVKMIRR